MTQSGGATMRILTPLEPEDEDQLSKILEDMVRRADEGRWWPINTAPKDGRELLVFCPSHHLEAYNDFFAVARWVDQAYDGREGWFDNFDMLYPTHWMPIPGKPK
jgi:hypothetical protein